MILLSKPFKVSIGVIATILGCFFLSIVIGYTVDILILPRLKSMGKESQENFNQVTIGNENAWTYYKDAIQSSQGITTSQPRIRYIRGEIEITPGIKHSLLENQEALTLLIAGSKKESSPLPVLFENRGSYKTIDLDSLRLIVELLCVRSLVEMEKGNVASSLEDLFAAFAIGKHISAEAPTVIDQITGGVVLSQSLRVLTIGLSSGAFETDELKNISVFLRDLETTLPPVNTALNKQMKLLKITISHRPISDILYIILIPHHQKKPSILLKFFVRLLYWRYLFSPRYAFLQNFRFYDSIILEMKDIEALTAHHSKSPNKKYSQFPAYFSARIKKQSRKNPLPPFYAPKFTNRGRLTSLTRIRMLQLSTAISLYHKNNGFFPPNIEEFDKKIAFDFNTNTFFEFSNLKDSVILHSLGLSPENQQDDIVIILTKKGIKKYLENRRKKL